MRRIIAVSVLGLIAETHARHPSTNDKLQKSMKNAVSKMDGKFVNKLLARGIQMSFPQHQELDKTTLHKALEPHSSAFSASRSSVASWNFGLARQGVPPAQAAVAAPCGLQCDFYPRNSAFAESLVGAYQKWYWPKKIPETTMPKSAQSCEFKKGQCPSYPIASSAVGTCSVQGMKALNHGAKEKNQDRGTVVYPFAGNPEQAFFAVYDGHGEAGEMVSEFTMNFLPDTLEKHAGLEGNEAAALETAFINADQQLLAMKEKSTHRGTTALAALMRGNQLWVANAGDCRCVLASKHTSGKVRHEEGNAIRIKVKDLSTDQKPDSPGERERIQQSGGYVLDPPAPGFTSRILPVNKMVGQILTMDGKKYSGLSLSRSIGDFAVKESGVIATPEIKAFELSSDDLFMIMASDGVWEFMSSQEAADTVWEVLQSGGDATKATDVLVETARLRWHKESEGIYSDDITAIVVSLPLLTPASVRKEVLAG